MSSTRREFVTETKVISEEEGIIEYVASSGMLDSHREIVDPRGWKFTRMEKNPVFVNSHNYWSIEDQLGRVISSRVKIGKSVEDSQLIQRVKWAIDVPECRLARLGFNMTAKGYLKAVSVGFIPVKYVMAGSEDFARVCAEMKLSTDVVSRLRCIYIEQEQIELSACLIGSCPDALARAFHEGAVKEAELAEVGFGGDREMGFLLEVGDKWKTLDPEARYRASNALAGITSRHLKLSKGNPTQANPPSKPDGGDAAKRLADEELADIAARLAEIAKLRSALLS